VHRYAVADVQLLPFRERKGLREPCAAYSIAHNRHGTVVCAASSRRNTNAAAIDMRRDIGLLHRARY
jgi:hypothetical protein